MVFPRRHTGNNKAHSTTQAPWDGPFAPAPSMASARINPMVRTAAELVGDVALLAVDEAPAAGAPAAA